ncbi:MAG: zf-HC2 domain-containing protein [Armatimonadia bacterium]
MSRCCDEYLLQAYVDRELDHEQAEAVGAPCRFCEPCARLLRELRVTCEALQVEPQAPPAQLRERLLQAVAGLQPLEAISCTQAQEWVSLQLDGELTHEEIQRLQAHLLACGACYRAASQTELATDVLRQVVDEAAPAGLLDRVQAAVALASGQPQARPTLWKRWGLSLSGVAAAAALLVALLTRVGPAPVTAPMVAQQPTPAPVVAVAKPSTPTASRVAAFVAKLAPATSVPAVKSQMRVAVSSSGRTTVTSVTHVIRPRTTPTVSPALGIPALSAPMTHESPRPVAVAVVPTAPERTAAPHNTIVAAIPAAEPAPRVEAPTPPAAHEVEAPRPTRVAAADVPSSARHPESAPVRVATKIRSSWVSREAEDDREVYAASEEPGNRLAYARRELTWDVTTIRNSQVREFVIR